MHYVAATRAKEKLILIHHRQHDYLPYLKKHVGSGLLHKLADVDECKEGLDTTTSFPKNNSVSVEERAENNKIIYLFKNSILLNIF